MAMDPIDLWHTIVSERDVSRLVGLLADDVVFYSPVVHTPLIGKAITLKYLSAAIDVLGNDSFRYIREVINETNAVLEFETEIDDITINGVDMIKWNASGQIHEFKVMIRPLKAVNLVHQRMAAMLAGVPS